MRKTGQSMFTLVELMIVVIIVAILAASSVPIYSSLVSRAYEADITAALGTVRTAQRIYRSEYGDYPADKTQLEDAGYISSDDFDDDMRVGYDELTVEGDGESSWDGDGDDDWEDKYDYSGVTMSADGAVSRSD